MGLRRYLAMKGKMGACPDWYVYMQAAKYLGVPVPDIDNVPLWWVEKALIAMTAEHQAQEILASRER
jgi:hypothetical protein